MGFEVKVPPMGESVTEASVIKISKKVGDHVAADDVVAVLETDKINVEVYAPAAGKIDKWLVKEGDTVTVDKVIAIIDQSAAQSTSAHQSPADSHTLSNTPSQDKTTHVSQHEGSKNSPAAGKMIAENTIDSTKIQGTGKHGMITKGDVVIAGSCGCSKPSISGGRIETRVKMTKLRQKIAERLKFSQNTAAILTTFNEVDMTNLMAVRNKYKDAFEKKHGAKLGFMSFFVKASINALLSMPNVNASIEGSEIVYRNYCDMGVAISTDNGLVVPVLRNADSMSFAAIESAIVAYGKKANAGGLSIDDMMGGTFTISNGGVFGSLLSTPIINPPQTAILGMHKIQERPVVIDGQIVIRSMMYLALSYDHRLIDGKEAVTFLTKVKQAIEDPVTLLLDM